MLTFSDNFSTALASPWSTYISGTASVSRPSGTQNTVCNGNTNATAYLADILVDPATTDVILSCDITAQTGTYYEFALGIFGQSVPIDQGIYFFSSKYSSGSYRLYAKGPGGQVQHEGASAAYGYTFALRLEWTAATRNMKVYANNNLIYNLTIAVANIPVGPSYLFFQRSTLWTATGITIDNLVIQYTEQSKPSFFFLL